MPPTLVFGDAKDLRLETIWTPKPSTLLPRDTIFLFDWDDTLLCSTWLCQTNGFNPESPTPPTLEMLNACDKLSTAVVALLTRATELGQVMIITNATDGWVEQSCAAFMPTVLPLLTTIYIVSARSRYKHMTSDANEWKEMTFRDELMWRVLVRAKGGRYNIISIGDGIPEQEAIRSFNRSCIASGATTKSIKLIEMPEPDKLIRQLELIVENVESLVLFPEGLDLQIGLLDLPEPVTARGPRMSIAARNKNKKRRVAFYP